MLSFPVKFWVDTDKGKTICPRSIDTGAKKEMEINSVTQQ